jgi:hypothetical protein
VRAATAASILKSTPIKAGMSFTVPYTTNHEYYIKSCTTIGGEMKGFLVGPMPAQAFLDDFFPTEELPDLVTVPSFEKGCYAHTLATKKKPQAYTPFISQFS